MVVSRPNPSCFNQFLKNPGAASFGALFTGGFFMSLSRNRNHQIDTNHVNQLLIENKCQQAFEYAQTQKDESLLDQIAYSQCERKIRVNAFCIYAQDPYLEIIYDLGMEALQHNNCEELSLHRSFNSDYQLTQLSSLLEKKKEKGNCLPSTPLNREEEGFDSKSWRGNFFEAFNKYLNDKNWIGVCRVAKHIKNNPYALFVDQRKEVIAGLKQLIQQESVSLGLKEFAYWILADNRAYSPLCPDDLSTLTEFLKNQFLEKGDLIRAERIMSIV